MKRGYKAPYDNKFVTIYMCFNFKFDPRRKAKMVTGGNMIGDRDEDTYCGVVKIDTSRTYVFLGHIKDL